MRNARTERGTNTASRPTNQPGDRAVRGAEHVAVPDGEARLASTASVTGLISANPCTMLGMESAGTNSEEANVSGVTYIRPAEETVSGSFEAGSTKAGRLPVFFLWAVPD